MKISSLVGLSSECNTHAKPLFAQVFPEFSLTDLPEMCKWRNPSTSPADGVLELDEVHGGYREMRQPWKLMSS
jgi:hypothetical protein